MKTDQQKLSNLRVLGIQVILAALLAVGIWTSPASATVDHGRSDATMEACLMRVLKTAGAETTVGELKTFCAAEAAREETAAPGAKAAAKEESAIDARFKEEGVALTNAFVITPHKPNYILLIAYKQPNTRPYQNMAGENIDTVEMKFQLSYKIQQLPGC